MFSKLKNIFKKSENIEKKEDAIGPWVKVELKK